MTTQKPIKDSEADVVQRVLIVGLGSIGKRHARLLRQLLPNATLIGWRHRASDEAVNDIDHCVYSLADALQHQPQIAVLANPSPFHLQTGLELAQAGVHLLIEKPLAANADGVQALIELCQQQQLVLMTGYNLRFMPALQRLRDEIHQGRIGKVLHVRAEVGQYLPGWRSGSDYRTTVTAQSALGGGVLLELSHELDYLRWLFGEILWVSAQLRKQSSLELDVEDTALLQLGFAAAQGNGPLASVTLDCVRQDTTRECVVIGEAGTLRWQARSGEVSWYNPHSSQWQLLFQEAPTGDASYIAQWRHFLECVNGKQQPLVSGADGLAIVNVIEAARRSSQTGCVVHLHNNRSS